jgi:hypothetical protein
LIKIYRIIIKGKPSARITEAGAKIIWKAYIDCFRNAQTMEERESRGGIAHDIEIEYWRKKGYLPANFDFKNYLAK